MDDELRFHVEEQTRKLVAAGMSPADARRQALVRFGGVEQTKERIRDEVGAPRLEQMARELRFARRALARAPGFTLAAILTLALGIGATTAIFSIVNGVLLRPLPYPNQDRLVELGHVSAGGDRLLASPAAYFGYRDHGRAFEAVGLWDWDSSPATVTGLGEPESVPSLEVTPEVLSILGATPIAGRGFQQEDARPGAEPTVVISYGYWQRRFAGADAIGRTIGVAGTPRRIIGVLPPDFRFFRHAADVFYPLALDRATAQFPSGDGRGIALMKPGVTLDQANADAARVLPLLYEEFGAPQPGPRRPLLPDLQPLKNRVVGDVGRTLWLLLGTIGLLLLIACANVANLVLVRTQSRRPELVLRAALGAGWWAIARVVLAESLVLGLAGGALGLVVAYFSLPPLVRLGGDSLPGIMSVSIDRTVLLATAAVTAGVSMLCALMPLAHVTLPRLQLARTLYSGGRAMMGSGDSSRTRQALVVAQVAVAMVLLVGAGLMIRTFLTLRQVDPGFRDPEKVLAFQLTVPSANAPADADPAIVRDRIVRTHQSIAERLAGIAGVEAAGFASGNDPLPLDGDGRLLQFIPYLDGRQAADGVARVWEQQRASPGFFEAMRTPLVAGRAVEWTDVLQRRRVVLVSEQYARREWGSAGAAVGRRISQQPGGEAGMEVVGVIGDVRHYGIHQPPPAIMVMPAVGTETATYVVRSDRVGTPALVADLRRAVWSVDANMALADIRTLQDMYTSSMASTSMTLSLLAATGVMALVLGLIGIYGIVSYTASQRRGEIGVRLALGARVTDVRRLFVRRALVLVGMGVVIGLAGASFLTRLMETQLFGVRPLDPATHGAVALVLAAAAAAASYVSARRGTRLDPVAVLRGE